MHTYLKIVTSAVGALACAGVLFGWQSGLMPLGVTENQVREAAMNKLLQNMKNPPKVAFFTGGHTAAKRAFLALPADQRTAAAEAVAAVVKPLLLAPATKSAWNSQLAKQGGVDHGIQIVTQQTDMNQVMDQAKKQLLESRLRDAQEFAKNRQQFNAEVLTVFIDTEMSLLSEPDSMMAASSVAQKAALSKYREAKKLVASDTVAAQKALAAAKFLAVGVQPDSAGMADASQQVARNENAAKQRREQETFDQYHYGASLRAQLQHLIDTAATVDFQAATQKRGAQTVFVNPAYEGKSPDWKLLYRAGKGPVMVAMTAAKQVLAAMPR